MRHLYGAALAVIMTAAMFFAGSWGYLRLLKLPVPPGQATALPAGGGSLLSNSTVLLALAALAAIAVIAGVLAMVRWFSPLAAGLPGLLLLAWTGIYLVNVRRAVEFIPLRSHSFGAGWEGLLFNGILGAVGAVMIFPLFIPSRWRGTRRAEAEALASDVDDYLSAVTTDDRPRRISDRRSSDRRGIERRSIERRGNDRQREEAPLVGTVVGGRSAADDFRPVDTTRVTGASRALRGTGSFRGATGAQPRAGTGAQPRATGAQPRAAGSSRTAQDANLLRRPYYPGADE